MRSLIRIVAVCVPLLSFLPAGDATADPVKLRLAGLMPKNSFYHRTLLELGETWKKAQNDGSTFTVYTDGSQGGEADIVKRMRIGQLNAALISVTGLREIDKSVSALQSVPLAFRNWGEVDYVREKMRPA